jgi:CBS domain-containing protein
MLLQDICTPTVACCRPETSVLAAARQMRAAHVGDLVVTEAGDGDQVPLGIITDRDIVVEVIAQEADPARTAVKDVMRRPVVIAHGSEELAQAVERMRAHGVRRMPIMGADRRLIGIVTLDDLVRALAAQAGALVEILANEQEHEQRHRR